MLLSDSIESNEKILSSTAPVADEPATEQSTAYYTQSIGQEPIHSKPQTVSSDEECEQPAKQSAETKEGNEMRWGKVHKNELIRGLLDRKHQCKWCSLRFYTKSQLKQHETTHMNSVLYCPVCDKQFTHKDRLSGHMKCHMEPSLECKVCGKKFKRLCNLYNHELVHGLTEHAFMLCQFCGRGFRSRRDYQNHVIANHRDQLMKTDMSNCQNDLAAAGAKKDADLMPSRRGFNTPLTRRALKFTAQDTGEQIKTTTVLLSNESDAMVDLESDTYFTRTGTSVHHFENIGDESDVEESDEDDEEDQNEHIFNNEFANNNDSSNSGLNYGHCRPGKKANGFNKKSDNSIKNKIKRLKTSLNIEVVDDEEHSTSLLDNHRNQSYAINNGVPYSTSHLIQQQQRIDNSSTNILVQIGDEADMS